MSVVHTGAPDCLLLGNPIAQAKSLKGTTFEWVTSVPMSMKTSYSSL